MTRKIVKRSTFLRPHFKDMFISSVFVIFAFFFNAYIIKIRQKFAAGWGGEAGEGGGVDLFRVKKIRIDEVSPEAGSKLYYIHKPHLMYSLQCSHAVGSFQ
jgi:hypothetical protein